MNWEWFKFYLPVFATIVVVVFILTFGRGCFEEGCPPGLCAQAEEEVECFKPAPEPVYTAEKDYGYREDVPCDTDEYPNAIMKSFQNGGTNYIFIDMGKDGTCDYVSIWTQPDRSKDAWRMTHWNTCEDTENIIKTQIKFKKSLEGSE
jgi:hypothetical protein